MESFVSYHLSASRLKKRPCNLWLLEGLSVEPYTLSDEILRKYCHLLMRMCAQAVKKELLEVLTMTAERTGYNKSVLLVGARGSGKTLVSKSQIY